MIQYQLCPCGDSETFNVAVNKDILIVVPRPLVKTAILTHRLLHLKPCIGSMLVEDKVVQYSSWPFSPPLSRSLNATLRVVEFGSK
jgi:hypothetical protein